MPTADDPAAPLLEELDRLEELLEEMRDLNVESTADIVRRIAELNAAVDDIPQA